MQRTGDNQFLVQTKRDRRLGDDAARRPGAAVGAREHRVGAEQAVRRLPRHAGQPDDAVHRVLVGVGGRVARRSGVTPRSPCSLASVAITLYITWSFRNVPNSLRYGVSAIVALLHDVLLVVGIFSILGKFFDIEVNTFFITGLLTVVGFSVHDSIVVFDRIRENVARGVDPQLPGRREPQPAADDGPVVQHVADADLLDPGAAAARRRAASATSCSCCSSVSRRGRTARCSSPACSW